MYYYIDTIISMINIFSKEKKEEYQDPEKGTQKVKTRRKKL